MRHGPPALGLAALSLVAALSSVALVLAWPVDRVPAGIIRGRVRIAETPPVMDHRPALADLGAGGAREPADRRRSVVYLDPAPRSALADLPAGRARIDQRGEQFVPRVLAITVGTTVDFPNNDAKFHNVFSLSRTKSFDLGRYPAGQSKSVRFDRAGIVRVFCDIHSHMSASILVFAHPFFAVTDDDGRYAIPSIPAGTYSVMAWSELGRAGPRTVTVTDDGIATEDFDIGPAQLADTPLGRR